MFENVDGRTDRRTTDGRTTDAGVTGILIAHLGAFGSGELIISSHGGHLTNALYHHGKNTLIKLLHHDETKKRAHDSQIVRAKENLKLSHGGSSYR